MAAVLKKVHTGDPLVVPAETFNTFIDAARDFQARQRSAARSARPDVRRTGLVPIRNESGADRNRFDVLGINGPIIKPTDNADGFKERVALKGATPVDIHAGRFAILLEPVANNEIGLACVDGVTVARVKMLDEGHTFAEIKVNDATVLQSGASGSAALLWVQPAAERAPDPTIAWTIARLANGAPRTWVWAVVVGYNGDFTRLQCKLLGENGIVPLDAAAIEVRIFAASDAGFYVDPPIEECSPLFLPSSSRTPPDWAKVKIEYRTENHDYPGSTIRPGWWVAQDVWLTCFLAG